jgi:hypothetical protein
MLLQRSNAPSQSSTTDAAPLAGFVVFCGNNASIVIWSFYRVDVHIDVKFVVEIYFWVS